MSARKVPILCAKSGVGRRGPRPICTFALTRQEYGQSVSVQAICAKHGGEVNIAVSLSEWTTTGVRS